MTSKRDGSILDFLTKKMKSTTLFSTEEIELTEVSTISEDKTHEASSLIQNAPVIDLLNPSNINDLPENYDESENESEFLSYDGASSMSGIYGDVSALVLKQQSKAFFVHYIIDFVSRSPKRLAILKEISNQLSMPYSNLTSLCPTRWTMRAESYNSLLNNYKLVQEALYTLIEEKGGPGIKTNGLHEQMNKFYFFFGLKLDDINFKLFYTKVLKESESLTDKPILARYRRPPKQFYRQQYMESLEIVINMLQNRFTQKNLKLLCNVEQFILYAANNSLDDSNDYFQSIMDFCYGDIDIEKLKVEALMIVDFFQSVIKTNQMNIKQITKISTIWEVFNSRELG
ncbi:unnamed protein product [Rotaria magnacalcarata]|uniref:Uncharacterized protein n=3 Tax=Rotaria magnacalcarata TaxID=392030 RepID=A0A8S2LEV2_9BILA|nr:unnamed protein product [Rotaria magnacalcarata]